MSGSDSDGSLSTPANLPNDADIESTLRRIVRHALKRDEEITINTARARAEKELELPTGFFGDNVQWKAKSRDLVRTAATEPESPEKPKKSAPKKDIAKAGTKRKSDEPQAKQKRRKKEEPVVDSSESEHSDAGNDEEQTNEHSKLDGKKTSLKPQPKSEEESALSEPPDEESEPAGLKQNGKPVPAAVDDDGSDLSSVMDDPPPKKKRQKKKSASPSAKSKGQPKPQKSSKSTTASKPDLSLDEDEIKKLQSWLLKCGIRKLWHRELAPYSTSKEKTKHLKSMLDDVGMTGRYSVEKARQIKEQRELKAELEAARQFNEQWGHEEREDGKQDGADEVKQPTRRLKPKGLVDFGDDDDDSE